MSTFNDKDIEDRVAKIVGKSNEEINRNWNEELGVKFLVIMPSLIFLISFLVINRPKNLYELLGLIIYPLIFILLGVLLLFVMEK